MVRRHVEGLADLPEALRWVEQHWSEQPAPPVRLHEQGVEPESQLGAPKLAAVFWRYLTVQGDAMESVSVTQECSHPRLPQHWDPAEQRAILHGILCACTHQDCDRLHCPDCFGLGVRTMTRDRFTYPMAYALDRLAKSPGLSYAIVVTLARHSWAWSKVGVTAPQVLTAIRKLHSRYSTAPTPRRSWTDLSESQRNAESAA